MSVDHMLKSMPATEIVEWQAHFNIESTESKNARAQKELLNRAVGKKGRRARR